MHNRFPKVIYGIQYKRSALCHRSETLCHKRCDDDDDDEDDDDSVAVILVLHCFPHKYKAEQLFEHTFAQCMGIVVLATLGHRYVESRVSQRPEK